MTETITPYSYSRTGPCPFDPAPELLETARPVRKVRTWGGHTSWLVTGYDELRIALADPRLSADARRPGFPHLTPVTRDTMPRTPSLTTMDGPEHAARRRMLTKYFAVKRVERLRPRVQHLVDDLVDSMLDAGNTADLYRDLALPVPSLVICDLLGVPYEDHDFFQRTTRVMVSSTSTGEETRSATREITAYLDRLVAAKQDRPGDDLISGLCAEQGAQGLLSREQIADAASFLLFAGHETTANMIALSTAALFAYPAQHTLLRDAPDTEAVAGAVEELLRYLSIVQTGRRRIATQELELGGEQIKASDGVILALDAANRDPRAFGHYADTLDLHRPSRHHVAFGFGVHQCLGQPLARMELQVVHATLHRRIPTLAPAIPLDRIRFKQDSFVYGVHELPVTWQ
ncbi:cytochrome P450 [Streptomyces chartreusis]|uniref:cytochrome P450 n=1 Tax=Streptomyces chartreusis TaxID=1969 RepID=UPI003722FE9D